MKQQFKRVARLVELCLLIFSACLLAYFGCLAVQASETEEASASFGTTPRDTVSSTIASQGGRSSPRKHQAFGSEPIGRLEIPSVGLTVPILADYETESLLHGVGHIPGTAMPGGLGTMGLAGHRDTYFRPLRAIRAKMDIRVSDRSGTYHYEVDSTEIVRPEDVQVLDIKERPELTLVTCYPFNFIGAAPRRFIVHAHLLSALPD